MMASEEEGSRLFTGGFWVSHQKAVGQKPGSGEDRKTIFLLKDSSWRAIQKDYNRRIII